MSVKTRLSPRDKVRIFLEGPKDNVKVAEVCRREEIWPNEYSRPYVRQDQAVLERFFRTLKQGEVYHQEYENHYQAQDGISKFIDYYNHQRPHQGIGFVTPYQKLTGQEKRIIKERRTKALATQKVRKIKNRRRINLSINEEMTSVKNRNKKILV